MNTLIKMLKEIKNIDILKNENNIINKESKENIINTIINSRNKANN